MALLSDLSQVHAIDLLRELDRRQLRAKRTSRPYFEAFTADANKDLARIPEAAILATLRLPPNSPNRTPHRPDRRRDIFQVTDSGQLAASECLVAMIKCKLLTKSDPDHYLLKTQTYGSYKNLCPSENFWLQPSAFIYMTGSLVRPNIVLTAGHGLISIKVQDYCFIRGWSIKSPWKLPLTIHRSDVFHIKRTIDSRPGPTTDWALIEISDNTPKPHLTRFRTSGKIDNKRPLYAIGYPYGLPAKLIDGANVLENGEDEHFSANLDTYEHNSGSPVFDAFDHTLEGIFVRGTVPFYYKTQCGCWVGFTVSDYGGPGQECTRTAEFLRHLEKVP